MKKFAMCLAVGLALSTMVGCRDYNVPKYVEIKSNETAFMIPLESDNQNQSHFQSAEYLQKNLIAAQRVQIPRRWNQTGRLWFDGGYMDTVRVITVDRSPQTRYWTADGVKGTSAQDQAIDVETSDSVALNLDITCTAMIQQQDVPLFLFRYPSGDLHVVMDSEIRAKVQTSLTEEVAKHNLESVKKNKGQIIVPVREEVTAFFKERGITITNIGLGGGLTYRNPDIQKSIDKTIQDAQLQISAEARFQAQLKENQTINAAAEAAARAAETKAKGEAAAIKALADAQEYQIGKFRANAGQYIQLRQLEALTVGLNKWDGKLPFYNMSSGGQSPLMMFSMPSPEAATPSVTK